MNKPDPRNIALAIFGVVLALLVLEVIIRLTIWVFPGFLAIETQTNEFLIENRYWKNWHFPNHSTRHTKECFDALYQTNGFGLKDSPIDGSKPVIALIGDSYVEGYSVSNGSCIDKHLEKGLSNDYEVLNFGTSGGFGTVHEASLYENYVQYFDPEIVVLYFLSYNDLHDNINAIREGFADKNLDLVYPTADSAKVFRYVAETRSPKELESRPHYIYLYYLLHRGFRFAEITFQMALSTKFEFRKSIGDAYRADYPENIPSAYVLLAKSLRRIKQLTDEHGVKLVIANIPTSFQIDPGWKEEFEMTFREPVELDRPNREIKAICDSLGVPLIDPLEDARAYINEHDIAFPYYYNNCDRHFNELGNKMMAKWTLEGLQNVGVLKSYVVEN